MQRNFRANAKPPDPKEDLLLYKKMREMISYGNGVLNNGQFPRKYRIEKIPCGVCGYALSM